MTKVVLTEKVVILTNFLVFFGGKKIRKRIWNINMDEPEHSHKVAYTGNDHQQFKRLESIADIEAEENKNLVMISLLYLVQIRPYQIILILAQIYSNWKIKEGQGIYCNKDFVVL